MSVVIVRHHNRSYKNMIHDKITALFIMSKIERAKRGCELSEDASQARMRACIQKWGGISIQTTFRHKTESEMFLKHHLLSLGPSGLVIFSVYKESAMINTKTFVICLLVL